MTVAHWRAPYWDVLRGMAVSTLAAGSALAGININININSVFNELHTRRKNTFILAQCAELMIAIALVG